MCILPGIYVQIEYMYMISMYILSNIVHVRGVFVQIDKHDRVLRAYDIQPNKVSMYRY